MKKIEAPPALWKRYNKKEKAKYKRLSKLFAWELDQQKRMKYPIEFLLHNCIVYVLGEDEK